MGAALNGLRATLEAAKGANNAQLAMVVSNAVADVQSKLLEVQQQALALQQENADLRAEVARAKADALVFLEGNVYWEKRSDGRYDGPLCPVCWGLTRLSGILSAITGCHTILDESAESIQAAAKQHHFLPFAA